MTTNLRKKSLSRSGIAIPIVIFTVLLAMGAIFTWWGGSENFRLSTISEKDRKFLTQKAMTASDIVRKRTLSYLHTLSNSYSPQNPIMITGLSAQTIGFDLDPGEEINLQCLGQGDFRFSSSGGTLAPCDNNPKIYPKTFSLSFKVANSDRSVVSNFDQTFEIGPEGLNRFALVISGTTNPRIVFTGGHYLAPVILTFDSSVAPTAALQFVTPPTGEVTFAGAVHTNVNPQNSYFGLSGLSSPGSSVGPVNFEAGYVQYGEDYIPKPINITEGLQDPSQFTITHTNVPPRAKVKEATVYLGGENTTDRCLFQIQQKVETTACTQDNTALKAVCSSFVKPAPTAEAPPAQEMKLDIFPFGSKYAGLLGAPLHFLSAFFQSLTMAPQQGTGTGTGTEAPPQTTDDATVINGETATISTSAIADTDALATGDATSVEECVDLIMTTTSAKAMYLGGKFHKWDGNFYVAMTIAEAEAQYCPGLSLTAAPPLTTKPDDCVAKYKAQSNRLAGYAKTGEVQTCTTSTTTYSFPASPEPVTADTIYWVRSTEKVTFRPLSGKYMSVCTKFTVVTDAPSTGLHASILQSSAAAATAGISDPDHPDFSPNPKSNHFSLVAKQGPIVILGDAVPLKSSEATSLAGLKALNVSEDTVNFKVEGTLVSEQASPLASESSLTSSTSTGTYGGVEVIGSLMGKDQAFLTSVTAYGQGVVKSGAANFSLNYNTNLETDPPNIFTYGSESAPLVATVVNQGIGFTDVKRAIAEADRSQ